jgi:hypothetical protein
LISMGRVLTANRTVETVPAKTATLAMPRTLRRTGRGSRRVRHPICGWALWVNPRTNVAGRFASPPRRAIPEATLGVHRLDPPQIEQLRSERASAVRSLPFHDPRAVQPAMQRETSEEVILPGLQPREPDPGDTGKSRLLGDDLDVAE